MCLQYIKIHDFVGDEGQEFFGMPLAEQNKLLFSIYHGTNSRTTKKIIIKTNENKNQITELQHRFKIDIQKQNEN